LSTYELIIIIKGSISEEIEPGKEQVEKIFSKFNISVSEKHEWQHKKLWHPIDKIEDGSYNSFICEIDPQKIKDIQREFTLASNVLRTFFVKIDKKKVKKENASKKIS